MNKAPKVLIVEAEPVTAQLLVAAINEDYNTILVQSGAEAVRLATSVGYLPPDLIVLDTALPDISGFEVCRRIKESPCCRDIPVLFLAHSKDHEDEIHGLGLGAVDFIKKREDFCAAAVRMRIQNILETKRLRDQLAEKIAVTEGRYQAFLNASQDALIIVNDTGAITEVSRRTAGLLGWRPEELVGQTILKVIPTVYDFVDGGENILGRRFETEAVCRDRKKLPVEVAVATIRVRQEIAISLHDITPRLKLEEQKNRLIEQERHHRHAISNALHQMASAVSTRIGDPVKLIALAAETFNIMDKDGALAVEIDKLRKSVSSVTELIDHLAALDPYKMTAARTDLNDLIEQCLDAFVLDAHKKGINIVTTLAGGLPPVKAVVTEIKQVVISLVINACDATLGRQRKEKGYTARINVATSYSDDRVSILVHDNGGGVPEGLEEKIFEPFFTTHLPGAGAGLGLSVSCEIMERHGSGLVLHNRPGRGASFEAWLTALSERYQVLGYYG